MQHSLQKQKPRHPVLKPGKQGGSCDTLMHMHSLIELVAMWPFTRQTLRMPELSILQS